MSPRGRRRELTRREVVVVSVLRETLVVGTSQHPSTSPNTVSSYVVWGLIRRDMNSREVGGNKRVGGQKVDQNQERVCDM